MGGLIRVCSVHATATVIAAATQERASGGRTRRHIQEVKLMLPKIPDRANVTGNACAAAAIEVEASSGMAKVSSLSREELNLKLRRVDEEKEKEEEREKGRGLDKVKVERRGGGATKVGITRLASDNGELEDQIGDRSCCRKAENVDPIPIPEEKQSLCL